MNIQSIKENCKSFRIKCCSEKQCKLKIDTTKKFVILKGELIVKNRPQKICDCLIFQNDGRIILVELKSKSLNSTQIHDKFTNSVKEAMYIVDDPKSNLKLFFVLLTKSHTNSSTFNALKQTKIRVHGVRYNIRMNRCGESLKRIIAKC